MGLAEILAILSVAVPNLVSLVVKQFPSAASPDARQWVKDGVHALLTKAESFEPSWAKTLTEGAEPLIDAAINYELGKLGIN